MRTRGSVLFALGLATIHLSWPSTQFPSFITVFGVVTLLLGVVTMGHPELTRKHPVLVAIGGVVFGGGVVLTGAYIGEFLLGPVPRRTTPLEVMTRWITVAMIGAISVAGGYITGIAYRQQYDTSSSYLGPDKLLVLGLFSPVLALFGLVPFLYPVPWAGLSLAFVLGGSVIEGTLVCLALASPNLHLRKVVR